MHDFHLQQCKRIAQDKSRVTEPLEIVKLICKDFYLACFNKQMDNLKTNHKGVFVLTDNQFPLLSTFSSYSSTDTASKAQLYLKMVCGMMQGALDNLGLSASVQVDSTNLPCISYHIKATYASNIAVGN